MIEFDTAPNKGGVPVGRIWALEDDVKADPAAFIPFEKIFWCTSVEESTLEPELVVETVSNLVAVTTAAETHPAVISIKSSDSIRNFMAF